MQHDAVYDSKHGKGLKILSPKWMLQRFPIALAQVKTGDTSENLLNKTCQIIYREKEITKKAYNNIKNSIKVSKNDTLFMNSENSKTSDPHGSLLNILNKINWKGRINMLLSQILAFTIDGKIQKDNAEIIS